MIDRETEFTETVVHINRVAKVVKGGKNFSFTALVVAGDGEGRVGFGTGKAREVPAAIQKAMERAKRTMIRVPMVGGTLPHAVWGRWGATRVMLKPAAPGTGVIAGGGVRAVMESAGVQDVLTKVVGSRNPFNVVRAVFQGFEQMLTRERVVRERGLESPPAEADAVPQEEGAPAPTEAVTGAGDEPTGGEES